MLSDILVRYLREFEISIRGLEGAYVERYEDEILLSNRADLRIRVRFQSGSLLELNEAIIVVSGSIRHLGYRYHFQHSQN